MEKISQIVINKDIRQPFFKENNSVERNNENINKVLNNLKKNNIKNLIVEIDNNSVLSKLSISINDIYNYDPFKTITCEKISLPKEYDANIKPVFNFYILCCMIYNNVTSVVEMINFLIKKI